MTPDFWVLAIVFTIFFIASFIMAMFVSPSWAAISAVPTLAAYAWFLWNQYCLRSGDCTVLAWLNVALFIIGGLSFVVSFAVWLYYYKKGELVVRKIQRVSKDKDVIIDDKDDDKKKRDDKEEFYFPVGVPHHMMFARD
jgi:hypothetical protein